VAFDLPGTRMTGEWPEGWERGASHIAHIVGWKDDDDDVLWFGRSELQRILATGPDMLARWDELVGGDA
jgi:hypothetical protein